MNAPDDTPKPKPSLETRLASLPPEEKDRIGSAMRLRLRFENLLLEGLGASYDLMTGRVPAPDVAKRLIDLQHMVRQAGETMFDRPLQVAHAMAVLSGETKLDEKAWLKRMRIDAAQARIEREERSRMERFNPVAAPSVNEDAEEPETGAAPGP